MVSFSCEACGDVCTKKKVEAHRKQCHDASFTCLDCMLHFRATEYKFHTACISEEQKYQGKLYREKKPKSQHQKKDSAQPHHSQALVAANTTHHVDAEEADDADAAPSHHHSLPPRAPTPPPAPRSLGYHEPAALPAPNVFDFLDDPNTPHTAASLAPVDKSRGMEDDQSPAYEEYEAQPMPTITDVMQFQVLDEDDESFEQNGFAYGREPIRPSRERHNSFTTPAPKSKPSTAKSRDTDVETTSKKDRKRKRNSPAQLNMEVIRAQREREGTMTAAAPMLHSGLTGGLNRLLNRPELPPSPEDSADYANSPLSPMKRAKQGHSRAFERAQKEWEWQETKQRRSSVQEAKTRAPPAHKKEKEGGGRERDQKERRSSTALIKFRSNKKKREDPAKEVRRPRRRPSSSPSVSPACAERKTVQAIEGPRSGSAPPALDDDGQLILRPSGHLSPVKAETDVRAELFMSFITKGPKSGRGMSVNKALKRYHRERFEHGDRQASKTDEEKELWKNMRLRRNERGEIVLFFAPPDAL